MRRFVTVLAVVLAGGAAFPAEGAADRLVGSARCGQVRFFGLAFSSVTSKVEVEGPKWLLTDIRGEFFGGGVFGRAELDASGRFLDVAAFVSVRDADLGPLARERGLGDLSGKIEAAADLRWVGADRTLTGAVRLGITDGDLGAIPMGVKIFRFLGSPDIFGKRLTSADAALRLTPQGIVVESIKVASPNNDVVLVVESGGTVGYDGKLDLRVQPVIRSKLLSKIPIAGHLAQAVIGFLQRRSMRVRVSGTVAEPRFSWSPAR